MGAESEEVLRRLCNGSFLSLWSIPNPFSDDGVHKRGEGKELCDLLVVFGDDVIIFSDKSCAFSAVPPPNDKPTLNWDRWYRKAITKSVDQIYGAERWLRQFPQRVFADSRCTKPLNVRLPSPDRARYHRIVVALGAGGPCRAHYEGGSGSLVVSGGGPATLERPARQPFSVGEEGIGRGFVHVFDDVTLRIMLEELDTIVDFTGYLRKKEELFASTFVVATGEEDLLGHYLLNVHKFLQEDVAAPLMLFVDESQYATLRRLPQYIAGKQANRESYVWDRLVEHFIGRWAGGDLVNAVEPQPFEKALRIMAGTSRLERRQLGAMVRRVDSDYDRFFFSALLGAQDATTAFAAAMVPVPPGVDLDTYRTRRVDFMTLYARSVKVRHPGIERAVVVGFGKSPEGQYSEDIVAMSFDDWSEEVEAATRHDMELLQIGAPMRHFVDHEFPIAAPEESRAQRRRRLQIERGKLRPTTRPPAAER